MWEILADHASGPVLGRLRGPGPQGWVGCLEVVMIDLGWSSSALAAYSDSGLVALVLLVFACLACLALLAFVEVPGVGGASFGGVSASISLLLPQHRR